MMIDRHIDRVFKSHTFFRPWTPCSATPRVWILLAPPENWSGFVGIVVWVAKIVIDIIVIDPFKALALSLTISSQKRELFCPQSPKAIWGLGWQVRLPPQILMTMKIKHYRFHKTLLSYSS